MWCARITTTFIWWWPPTKAPRVFPMSPTPSRASTTSGWAMHSRRAAASATTTKKWASPRAVRGSRWRGIFAKSALISRRSVHRGRHRRYGGRCVRQWHAAVATYSAGRSVQPPAYFYRSQSGFGSVLCRARAVVQAAALSRGPTTTASLISAGGGVVRAPRNPFRSATKYGACFVAWPPSQLAPNELIVALLKAPVDLLWNGGIGTYIKASTQSHRRLWRQDQRRAAHQRS